MEYGYDCLILIKIKFSLPSNHLYRINPYSRIGTLLSAYPINFR